MRHAAIYSHLSLASTAAMLSSLLSVANMAATSSRLGTPPGHVRVNIKENVHPCGGTVANKVTSSYQRKVHLAINIWLWGCGSD